MSETITLAAGSNSVVTSALQLFSQFAIIGGGLWAVWGVITLAGGLKDQNGPATQSGVWQVVGGGLIIAAAALFSTPRPVDGRPRMVDFIVGILNSIGSGVGDDLVADLLKTPAEYNAGMYRLSLTIAGTAVKPIASTILAILCVLELARVSTRADGDRELGVKLVAMAMFKLVLVFTAAQHSELMLKAIDEIGEGVLGGIHTAAPTTGSASGLGLGDSMRDAIDSAGTFGQIPCLILLIIPFLVSKGATIVVTVVILLRFVQIYMLTAFNPLPIAFIAQEETRQWGVNYFKQYASLVFQCATLYLAILMYRTFVGGTLSPSKYKDGDSLSGWVLDNFTGLLLASVMLIGIVMAANSVAKKLFGGE